MVLVGFPDVDENILKIIPSNKPTNHPTNHPDNYSVWYSHFPVDHRWIHFFGWDENASWNFSPSSRTSQTRENIPRYVLFRWIFLWVFQRWWDNNDTDFTLVHEICLKMLSFCKLENMAIRLLLTGASEGWSAPGTSSQGQSASGWSMMNLLALGFISMVSTTCRFCNQGSPVNQLMIIHGRVPWQVEIPSQQMSMEALMITIELYCTNCSGKRGQQLQLDWRRSWGGLLYPTGCS